MKTIRVYAILAGMAIFAVSACHAQSGSTATYMARCKVHGPEGIPCAEMAKSMGVRGINDQAFRKLTAEQMFTSVKYGKGRMKPPVGITDEQIREAVASFRNFIK